MLIVIAECRVEFGEYVQTHKDHINSMDARTTSAIVTRPTGNAQGGQGRCINWNWNCLPKVLRINIVHRWKPTKITVFWHCKNYAQHTRYVSVSYTQASQQKSQRWDPSFPWVSSLRTYNSAAFSPSTPCTTILINPTINILKLKKIKSFHFDDLLGSYNNGPHLWASWWVLFEIVLHWQIILDMMQEQNNRASIIINLPIRQLSLY